MVASAVLVHAQSQAPQRIVSLVPAVTEMLFAMGAGSRVAGVSSYDAFPPEVSRLPRVGALVDPDFERILSLHPDLVVLYASQSELAGRLQRVGIANLPYRHAGLADITRTIREVGNRVGHAQAAERLARGIEDDIAAIRRAVGDRRRPATLIVFEREPGTLRGIFGSAGIGFMHDMLLMAGGADALQDVARESLQLSVEALIARAPDVIVEVQPSGAWPPERIAREQAVWAALSSIPAVRNKRVHIIADDRLAIPGPRVASAIRLLAETLHPDLRGW
jgi:iron complex transport system substrate-binding protein